MALPDKRDVEQRVLAEWVPAGARVLDVGCGRGVLLEYLQQARAVRGVGVDIDPAKITACVRRGLAAYQGDWREFMARFAAGSFDYVVCSRTVQELPEPAAFVAEALRVGRAMAVGFANQGYWRARWHAAVAGERLVNEVNPQRWEEARPANPLTVREFETFCQRSGLRPRKRLFLRGDWASPCGWWPNLRAGYALYELELRAPASPAGQLTVTGTETGSKPAASR